MSNKLTNVYRYRPLPGREYFVRELSTGICCQHEDPTIAFAHFDSTWAKRSPYQLVEDAPPKRDQPKPQTDKAIESEGDAVKFHRALLKAFHSDHHGHHTYTSDEIVGIVNRLWESSKAKV